MSDDLIARLRYLAKDTEAYESKAMSEAADEIERLRAALKEIACDQSISPCTCANESECSYGIARAALQAAAALEAAPDFDATKYQAAEERLCDCGAAGSGEGHEDWCKWVGSHWEKKGRKYDAQNTLEAAERQLAEAREALTFYSCDCQPGQCENGPLESNIDTVSCGHRARAALAREKKDE